MAHVKIHINDSVNGREVEYEVNDQCTIDRLLQTVVADFGARNGGGQARLVFAGRQLQPSQTLRDAGITDGSSLKYLFVGEAAGRGAKGERR